MSYCTFHNKVCKQECECEERSCDFAYCGPGVFECGMCHKHFCVACVQIDLDKGTLCYRCKNNQD